MVQPVGWPAASKAKCPPRPPRLRVNHFNRFAAHLPPRPRSLPIHPNPLHCRQAAKSYLGWRRLNSVVRARAALLQGPPQKYHFGPPSKDHFDGFV